MLDSILANIHMSAILAQGSENWPTWFRLIPWIAILAVMLVIMVLPGRQQAKKRKQMMAGMSKNDRVLTRGGIIGVVVEVREHEVILKVDESNNTRMHFAKQAIQHVFADKEDTVEVVQPETADEGDAGADLLGLGAAEEPAPEQAPPDPSSNIPQLSQITVVTLAVEPQYALVLKWASESDSSIDLVLRSAADIEDFAQPEAVTLEYMINRYDISLPPRLPHALENEFEYTLIKEAEELEAAAQTQE